MSQMACVWLFAPSFRNLFAVDVSFDGDALHIDTCCRTTLMVERVLRRCDITCKLRDDPRKCMARPVEVESFDARFARVLLQILDEAVR